MIGCLWSTKGSCLPCLGWVATYIVGLFAAADFVASADVLLQVSAYLLSVFKNSNNLLKQIFKKFKHHWYIWHIKNTYLLKNSNSWTKFNSQVIKCKIKVNHFWVRNLKLQYYLLSCYYFDRKISLNNYIKSIETGKILFNEF